MNTFVLTLAGKFNGVNLTGGYIDASTALFRIKVNVSLNNGTIAVVSGSYNTSNLIVNSDIDMLSTYKVKNLASPSFSGDAVTLNYLQSNYMLKIGLDTISLSYPCTGPVTLNNNRLQGVANGINNDEGVNLFQLNSYYPTQCIAQDSTVTMSLIGASNARMNGA